MRDSFTSKVNRDAPTDRVFHEQGRIARARTRADALVLCVKESYKRRRLHVYACVWVESRI